MKTPLVAFATLLLCALPLAAQTADELVVQGRNYLAVSNLPSAHASFSSALAVSPDHEAANVLAAATRILLLPNKPACSAFLTRLGVSASGRNIYDWTADFRHTSSGSLILPPNLYSSEGIAVINSTILPAVKASLANLERVQNPDFILELTAAETAIEPVAIDYGDILLLRALGEASACLGHTLNAHDFNVWINRLQQLAGADALSFQSLLANFPNFLTLKSKPELAASRTYFTNAVNLYLQASDFIRNSRTNDAPRLFVLDDEEIADEAQFRQNLMVALASVFEPVMVEPDDDHYVYAGKYFAGSRSVRSLLPRFRGDDYVFNSLPDYTLGGILIGEAAADVEAALRSLNEETSAGLYAGFLHGMRLVDGRYEWGPLGAVGLFVATNRQATMFGYNTESGQTILATFKLDDENEWFFSANGFESWGHINSEGWPLEGTLRYVATDTYIDIVGPRLPDTGPFQTAAGYYTGTWSVGGTGGKLRALLDAAGLLRYTEYDSSGSSGDAGTAAIDPISHDFSSTSVNGTELQGSIATGTRRISGTIQVPGLGSGTFVMTRSAFIPSEMPPVIVTPPKNLTVEVGKTAIFTAVAAGSPPLSYQWLSNGLPILLANKSYLSINAVDDSMSGVTYAVLVRNVVGETHASATLTVVPEATRPAITITSPINGARSTVSPVTITGLAKDNVQVSNVLVRANSGDWIEADTSDNHAHWSKPVDLSPGNNYLEAYAVDTSGNYSATSRIAVVYIQSDRLVVQKAGQGTLTPKYNGVVLQIGRTYGITATAGSGYIFSNWVGGAASDLQVLTNGRALRFTMVSNLVLQANFVRNPFTAVKGSYYGLFADPAERRHEGSGLIALSLSGSGAYSGSIRMVGKSYPFAGKFDPAGLSSKSVPRGLGVTPLALNLALDFAGAEQITGAISDGSWTAELLANRSVFNAYTNKATQFAGKYTLIFPGTEGNPALPGGHGYGSLTVSSGGTITFSGSLADGAAITQTVPVSRDGLWPLYVPLYTGKGSVWSWMHFDSTTPAESLEGEVSWIRPALTSIYYAAGFTNSVLAEGSRFTPPATSTTRVIEVTNGIVVFEGGNLGAPINNLVTLNSYNRIVSPASNHMAMTISVTTGRFSGSVIPPGTSKTVPFKGVLLQDLNAGFGYFLGTGQSGRVLFGAAPEP